MVNILALSVTCGDTSPKGRGLGKKMKFAWTAKGSHFGGAAEQSEAERARMLTLHNYDTEIETRYKLCVI